MGVWSKWVGSYSFVPYYSFFELIFLNVILFLLISTGYVWLL